MLNLESHGYFNKYFDGAYYVPGGIINAFQLLFYLNFIIALWDSGIIIHILQMKIQAHKGKLTCPMLDS